MNNTISHAIDQAHLIAQEQERGAPLKEVAQTMNLSLSAVSNRLCLLRLIPELQDKLEKEEISYNAAVQMSRLPPEIQQELLNQNKLTPKDAREAKIEWRATQGLIDTRTLTVSQKEIDQLLTSGFVTCQDITIRRENNG